MSPMLSSELLTSTMILPISNWWYFSFLSFSIGIRASSMLQKHGVLNQRIASNMGLKPKNSPRPTLKHYEKRS
ncbi:unnamed protein product [Triticum turgidum subsp. durum]|uniref:Uncharacterized protein n=1 Tax=Triticum turgidum subsp. durum TaxID=4567 RepID=A0A9R0VJ85_TRITD|nr:unnamed protein product [Triticum turgidum subsp. durum]